MCSRHIIACPGLNIVFHRAKSCSIRELVTYAHYGVHYSKGGKLGPSSAAHTSVGIYVRLHDAAETQSKSEPRVKQ